MHKSPILIIIFLDSKEEHSNGFVAEGSLTPPCSEIGGSNEDSSLMMEHFSKDSTLRKLDLSLDAKNLEDQEMKPAESLKKVQRRESVRAKNNSLYKHLKEIQKDVITKQKVKDEKLNKQEDKKIAPEKDVEYEVSKIKDYCKAQVDTFIF